MITPDSLTRDVVVESLYSRTCPACGGPKGEEKTLCYGCYHELPAAMRNRLYDRVGHGYEEAVHAALQFLKVEKFHVGR